MKPPCKDCEKRTTGCATSCKEWAEYVVKRNEKYAVKQKWSDVAGYAAGRIAQKKHRLHRSRRK